jgi:hypothetical protein
MAGFQVTLRGRIWVTAEEQEIEVCEHDDFMLQTAKSLVIAAVEAHMWLHNIDRQAAHD